MQTVSYCHALSFKFCVCSSCCKRYYSIWLSKLSRFPKGKTESSEYDVSLSLISLVSNLLFNCYSSDSCFWKHNLNLCAMNHSWNHVHNFFLVTCLIQYSYCIIISVWEVIYTQSGTLLSSNQWFLFFPLYLGWLWKVRWVKNVLETFKMKDRAGRCRLHMLT